MSGFLIQLDRECQYKAQPDFSVSDDTIQLENSVFTQLTTTDLTETGVLNTSNFKIGATAVEADDYVIYDSDTGALYYDANGSDASGATAKNADYINQLMAE